VCELFQVEHCSIICIFMSNCPALMKLPIYQFGFRVCLGSSPWIIFHKSLVNVFHAQYVLEHFKHFRVLRKSVHFVHLVANNIVRYFEWTLETLFLTSVLLWQVNEVLCLLFAFRVWLVLPITFPQQLQLIHVF
jgi:hypothetical protein